MQHIRIMKINKSQFSLKVLVNMYHYFSEFEFEGCCDYLTIYDGESTSASVLVPGSNGQV